MSHLNITSTTISWQFIPLKVSLFLNIIPERTGQFVPIWQEFKRFLRRRNRFSAIAAILEKPFPLPNHCGKVDILGFVSPAPTNDLLRVASTRRLTACLKIKYLINANIGYYGTSHIKHCIRRNLTH